MSQLHLQPVVKDIGDFEVRRVLPAEDRSAVGPFVFWDHFGPVTLPVGAHMDVRPHPHIGLATLTWLFDGQIMHRDSLGNRQLIQPGAVNWMTAGRGIVHSERTPEERRGKENPLHGLQIWLGLPDGSEDVVPDFQHYTAEAIPRLRIDDVDFDLIAGRALGVESPASVHSPLLYLAAELAPGQGFDWSSQYPEEAVYVVEGEVGIDGRTVPTHTMAVLPSGAGARVSSRAGARIAILGGEPLGRRYLTWNFVASSRERIREAASLWAAGGFDRVPGDEEFIPLPDHLKA